MTSPKKFDLQAWLAATDRDVRRDGKRIRAVVLRRRYAASIDRVWTAWTDGWKKLIVSGDPRPGETVVMELGQPNRTTSRILVCEPPRRMAVTWTYGDPAGIAPDEVEVNLSADGDGEGTLLELEHRSESGAPWAGGVGAGWEAGLLMFEVRFIGEDPAVAAPQETFPKLDAMWTELVGT